MDCPDCQHNPRGTVREQYHADFVGVWTHLKIHQGTQSIYADAYTKHIKQARIATNTKMNRSQISNRKRQETSRTDAYKIP
jgi:hypothetical protein